MKTTILLCAFALLTGCAYHDDNDRGRPADRNGFETSPRVDNEAPLRTNPDWSTTGRELPERSGPGGLGTPDQ